MFFSLTNRPIQRNTLMTTTPYDNSTMPQIFHPLLALIASATDRELAKYIEYLKQENKILRARIPGQIHTRRDERELLLKFGKPLGRAIESLITIVTPGTFNRWVRNAKNGQPRSRKPKGGHWRGSGLDHVRRRQGVLC
ncbi:MAG: hypothetical protein WD030_03550, partial [Pirellulales bacterium]